MTGWHRASLAVGPRARGRGSFAQNVRVTVSEPTYYRLAPALVARLMGAGLVALAVVMFVMTAVVASTSLPPDLLVIVLVVGLLVVFGFVSRLRTTSYVVRLDAEGYVVRRVRGVGVPQGRWAEVTEAVAAHPHDVACLVLHRYDGTTTTIPMSMLAIDRDRFALDVRSYLTQARG